MKNLNIKKWKWKIHLDRKQGKTKTPKKIAKRNEKPKKQQKLIRNSKTSKKKQKKP